ncbi:MAG: TIGR03986 family CRISPR-associated RAMP protein [Planctomycetaceae bacterium]|nr:TIGR03986 family CRISPR-associated RAMP protein [Planctomycetaceae bacterium]
MGDDRWVELPRQVDLRRATSDRRAEATYNFVPLPETVVRAYQSAEDLPSHAWYDTERNSGWFDVTLTTRSPLYIRCPLTSDEFERAETEKLEQVDDFRKLARHTPHFFYTRDTKEPVIPGSSLRGMLRAIVEIAGYGKVGPVTEEKLFYRCLDKSSLKDKYLSKFVEETGTKSKPRYKPKVHGGILRATEGGNWEIEPCDIHRVEKDDVARRVVSLTANGADLYTGLGPNDLPAYRNQEVHVKPGVAGWHTHQRVSHGKVRYFELWYQKGTVVAPGTKGAVKGTLVLTGPMATGKGSSAKLRNHMAFVFVPTNAAAVPVPIEVMELANHPAQITWWQERAFKTSDPSGAFAKGDPVFYLADGGKITFLGRAQMFRVPYQRRPLDLLPEPLRREADIDLAEALFGWTKSDQVGRSQDDRARSFAGRVAVTDATLHGEVIRDPVVTPKILSAPKPTAFQKYLTQDFADVRQLYHYDTAASGEDTPPKRDPVLRGHKRYWPQGEVTTQNIEETSPDWLDEQGKVKCDSSQHTQIQPVRTKTNDAKSAFAFRVYFENLDARELGALAWALHPLDLDSVPNADPVHALGMGKPLGLGAVKLKATLTLTDRQARYRSLFGSDGWQLGTPAAVADAQDQPLNTKRAFDLADRPTREALAGPFEEFVRAELGEEKTGRLAKLDRVLCLLLLMHWPASRPDWLRDEGVNRDRPVLPDPLHHTGNSPAKPLSSH